MSILDAIGNAPLMELANLNNKKPDVKIFGKYEGGKTKENYKKKQ